MSSALLVNNNEQRPSGGRREKGFHFFLRGRMMFCYHVNIFLTACLLSEIFTQQNPNFSPNMQFFAQASTLMLSAGFC